MLSKSTKKFTQPGAHILAQPCTLQNSEKESQGTSALRSTHLGEGRVALRLEPDLAHRLGLSRGRPIRRLLSVRRLVLLVAPFHQGRRAGLQCVVVGLLLEGDLARLPKVLLADLLLHGHEFCDEGVCIEKRMPIEKSKQLQLPSNAQMSDL